MVLASTAGTRSKTPVFSNLPSSTIPIAPGGRSPASLDVKSQQAGAPAIPRDSCEKRLGSFYLSGTSLTQINENLALARSRSLSFSLIWGVAPPSWARPPPSARARTSAPAQDKVPQKWAHTKIDFKERRLTYLVSSSGEAYTAARSLAQAASGVGSGSSGAATATSGFSVDSAGRCRLLQAAVCAHPKGPRRRWRHSRPLRFPYHQGAVVKKRTSPTHEAHRDGCGAAAAGHSSLLAIFSAVAWQLFADKSA